MAQRHEIERRLADERRDAALRSASGRTAYWSSLEAIAARESRSDLLRESLQLDGDVIECGVYRGQSLFTLCRILKEAGSRKVIYACDSFEGFPPDRVGRFDRSFFRPLSLLRRKFQVADDVPARILRFADYFDVPVQVRKGYFSATLPGLATERFCFVHLDVDLYESYRECLDWLYPRLVPGGVVVFDEYKTPKWPGSTRAIDEFFGQRSVPVEHLKTREIPAWFVRKPHVAQPERRADAA